MKKSFKWLFLYFLFLLFLTFFPENKEIQTKLKSLLEEEQSRVETSENSKNNQTDTDSKLNSEVVYNVVKVVDGDTFKIEFRGESRSVRMIGIDTPEVNHPSEPVQCYGVEASLKTKELIDGKDVRLEQDVSQTDRYGRILAYVWVDEVFINEKIVKEGYAFSSSYPPDVKYQDILDTAEIYARENKAGLWAEDTCNGNVYTGTATPDNQDN